jgi:AraC family transcriptional regulator, regulatory protein of adaptative response / methylphosphotriester-DNA alkyltransferase methyltransferase
MLTREEMVKAAFDRDVKYDGVFWVCVKTTGVYCLPSCKSRLPKEENMEFVKTRKQAEQRGYRACKRCKPDLYTPSDASSRM